MLTIDCYKKCVTCRLYGRECSGCSFCDAPLVCTGDCRLCPYMCINRPHAARYYLSVKDENGGDALIRHAQAEIPTLPAYIPTLPSRMHAEYNAADLPYVAVHGGKFMSADGKRIAPRYLSDGVHKALGLDPKTKTVLHFYVPDRTLEGFWQNRHQIYPVLKEMGFSFIIAPNFSVYEDSPRLEHLFNIKRSAIVCSELLEHGINAVPDISWYEIKDLDRWAESINRSGVKLVSFSFQCVGGKRSSSAWRGYCAGLRYLCESMGEDVSVIVVGIAAVSRLKEVISIAGNRDIVLVNTYAFMTAKGGRDTRRQKHEDLSLDELFVLNARQLEQKYSRLFCEAKKEGGM